MQEVFYDQWQLFGFEMKQILYFLIGVLISACIMIPYAKADCVETTIEGNAEGHYATQAEAFAAVAAAGSALDERCNWSCPSSSDGCYKYWTYLTTSDTNNGVTYVAYRKIYYCGTTSVSKAGTWTWASYGTAQSCATVVDDDADDDGMPDNCDIYPNDSTPYSIKMTSYQTVDNTSSGDKSYSCYVTDRGDTRCIGTDGVLSGSTDFVIAEGTWISGSDICTDNSSPSPSAVPDKVVSQPSKPDAPSSPGADGDSDSDLFKKIAGNSDSTNKNLDHIADLLGVTNSLLGKLNNKSGSSSGSGGAVVFSPTATEIGEAVEDSLIDPTQTIDTTTTDNIPALDETDTLTEIKTKYSDRYDLFISTLADSDLFTLPFSIFTGPSGSGSSVQTVQIGSWGQSSSQTATIDFSDYDNVWRILSTVLLMLTSFACFKILVLKKA